MTCTHTVAGTQVHVTSTVDGYIDCVKRALPNMDAPPQQDCSILVTTPEILGLSRIVWTGKYYPERSVEGALAGSRYRLSYFDQLDFWQFFDRETHRGIQVMTGPEGGPPWDSGSPLRNFLHWHFTGPEAGLIHGGTLGHDGQGLLLVGAGGSGKSGTVLSGIMRGWQSVGDDYVLVRTDPQPVASALFTTLKQDTSGIARLGLEAHPGIPRHTNWQDKHQFHIADVAEHLALEPLEIKAVCLPTVGNGGPTTLTPASTKEAFLALAPSGVSQIPGDRDATFAIAAKLVRALPCFHLSLGPDPDEILAALNDLFARVRT